MTEKIQEGWVHFQANTGNLMTAKEIVQVFNFADNMFEQTTKLSKLAQDIGKASPTELKKLAEETVNVCANCSDKIQCFTDGMKTVTNKISEGVKYFDASFGEAMQGRCAEYLDNVSGAKEIASLKEHLKECLVQENINQTNILEQIQQQKQQISESVQSAYKITSYFNFITAVFNFGMAVNALIQTCNIIEQHNKIMEVEKAKLAQLNVRLEGNRKEIDELMKNLNSVQSQNFNIGDSMYIRLAEISNSIIRIQLDLERIKGTLNIAINETQSQKKQHVTGALANGLGAVLSTVASVGQLANVWNLGAIGLNVVGSAISYIGIRKCNFDIQALQVLTKNTEQLIENAEESMKLIESARKQLSNLQKQPGNSSNILSNTECSFIKYT